MKEVICPVLGSSTLSPTTALASIYLICISAVSPEQGQHGGTVDSVATTQDVGWIVCSGLGLFISACIFSGFSGFLPPSKIMPVGGLGM